MISMRYRPPMWVSQIWLKLLKAAVELGVFPATYNRSSHSTGWVLEVKSSAGEGLDLAFPGFLWTPPDAVLATERDFRDVELAVFFFILPFFHAFRQRFEQSGYGNQRSF